MYCFALHLFLPVKPVKSTPVTPRARSSTPSKSHEPLSPPCSREGETREKNRYSQEPLPPGCNFLVIWGDPAELATAGASGHVATDVEDDSCAASIQLVLLPMQCPREARSVDSDSYSPLPPVRIIESFAGVMSSRRPCSSRSCSPRYHPIGTHQGSRILAGAKPVRRACQASYG
jgi:hypothetical protein